jgi:hypothetical protein
MPLFSEYKREWSVYRRENIVFCIQKGSVSY